LLGQEGSESPGWFPLADLASACLEQLIRPPPLPPFPSFPPPPLFSPWGPSICSSGFLFLPDEATHSFKIRAMKRYRETVVLRALHWQGILPSLLGQEGSESLGWFPLAHLASACLEQLISPPPPLTHVFHLLLCSIVGPVHLPL